MPTLPKFLQEVRDKNHKIASEVREASMFAEQILPKIIPFMQRADFSRVEFNEYLRTEITFKKTTTHLFFVDKNDANGRRIYITTFTKDENGLQDVNRYTSKHYKKILIDAMLQMRYHNANPNPNPILWNF